MFFVAGTLVLGVGLALMLEDCVGLVVDVEVVDDDNAFRVEGTEGREDVELRIEPVDGLAVPATPVIDDQRGHFQSYGET